MKNDRNKIGLIIADENEIQPFESFHLVKIYQDQFKVSHYLFNQINVYVINSKIGLVNATIATQFLIDKFNLKHIWNYGAVGATNKLKQYDVVIPNKFFFYDVITPWYKRGQTPNEKEYYLNSLNTNNNIEINIGSGNSFVSNVKYVEDIKKDLNIDLFDMESCAMAQTCDKNNVRFYCIKGVSDVIGKSNIEKENINLAISKASKYAFDFMIKIWNKN